MADGGDHVEEEYAHKDEDYDAEHGYDGDHAEDDEDVGCAQEGVIVFELSQASTHLHGAKH